MSEKSLDSELDSFVAHSVSRRFSSRISLRDLDKSRITRALSATKKIFTRDLALHATCISDIFNSRA